LGQIAGGNVATDPDTWTVRISALQYNPDLLSRTLLSQR
jgi:hypothetical protein